MHLYPIHYYMSRMRGLLLKIIDWLSFGVIVGAVMAMPWWVDGALVQAVTGAKYYLLMALLGMAVLFKLLKTLILRTVEYRMSVLDMPIVILVISVLASALFSVTHITSFIGSSEIFSLYWLTAVGLCLWYILLTNTVTSWRRWQLVLDALIVAGGGTIAVFVLKTVLHIDVISVVFGVPLSNTVAEVNGTFGLFTVLIGFLSLGQLVQKTVSLPKKIGYAAVALLAIMALALISFKIIWIVCAVALFVLLLLAVRVIHETNLVALSGVLALFIFTIIFILFDTPRVFQTVLPVEVSLNARESWSVTMGAWSGSIKNILIGTGPGTFGINFLAFKSLAVNTDPVAVSLRFNNPFSTVLALLSEGGVIVALSWLVVVIVTAAQLLAAAARVRAHRSIESVAATLRQQKIAQEWGVLLVGGGWLVLTVSMGWLFFGQVMWWLWFLLLGLLMVGLSLSNDRLIKLKSLRVVGAPERQVAFSFVLAVIFGAVIFGEIAWCRFYIADRLYARARTQSDYVKAESDLTQAIQLQSRNEKYYAAIAQVYLLQALKISQSQGANSEQVGRLVGLAVNQANRATEIAPRSVAVWENLATMYEQAAIIIPGARDWAIRSLKEAVHLEPSNPLLAWRLGSNYAAAGRWSEAVKNYESAIFLKNDYLAAYYGLANAYEQQGNMDKAISVYETMAPLGRNNQEVLFQYGRLLFNRNQGSDRSAAAALWQSALTLDSNHSNTLYSLGLWNETIGKRAEALSYYTKVSELNPNNQEVLEKIKKLK